MLDKNSFRKAIEDFEENALKENKIGTLNEKKMHATIKSFIASDGGECEVKINEGNIADVKIGNTLFEIQTENLFPMKKKLDFYFNNTDFCVNIVFPIAREKYTVWVDCESGEASKPHLSPKKRTLCDYADTLIFLAEYIGNPRLTLTLLYISECEYRNLDGKRSKNKKRGSTRIERAPLELLYIEEYKEAKDFALLLPEADVFTLSEYAKEKKLRSKRKIRSAVNFLIAVGLLRECGKRGNAKLYEKIKTV